MSSLLVVDDDRSICRIFQRCFEHSEVIVHAAASGAEAIKVAADVHPNVVVLDVVLPDRSGLSVCEELHQRNPAIPIVFITASQTSDTAIESMRVGAMDYLRKPLDMAKIREVIDHAIGVSTRNHVTAANESESAETASPESTSSDLLLGHSLAMQEVYKAIGRVADRNINVLIRGESGTGKEVVARAIHQHGNRA